MIRNTFFVLTALLIFASCRKKVEWDSNWVLALFQQELNLSKLENDSTLINDNGFYHVQLSRTLVDLDLTNFVKIPDTTIAYTKYLQLGAITINPGFEFMNSVEDHVLQLQDIELKRIHLIGGKIEVALENPVGTAVDIQLILPGATKNGQVLSKNLTIGPKQGGQNGVVNTVLDLSGYEIDLSGTGGTSFNKLQSQVVIKTSLNGTAVTVTNQDGFVVNAKFKDLNISYARGYFGSRIIQETEDFNLDVLKMVQSGVIDIPSTNIRFNIQNGIKMDLAAQLNFLKSTNTANNALQLQGGIIGNNVHVPSATGDWSSYTPGNYSFQFTSSNSNIEQFIEHLGHQYDLNYQLRLNPWGNTTGGWNEIFASSKLRVGLEIDMPLAIGANALVLKDTIDLSIDMSKDKTHISNGILVIEYQNAFPISGNLAVTFLDGQNQVIGNTAMSNGIQSSAFGTLMFNNLQYTKDQVEIPLSKDLLGKMDQIKKAVISAHLNSTNDATANYTMVQIPYGAFLRLKAHAKFVLNTKL